MMLIRVVASAVVLLFVTVDSTARPSVINPENWPQVESPVRRDPAIEKRVTELLARMTLEEKIGQVIQPSIINVTPADVKNYHLGSILNGGGGWPGDVRKATPADWLNLADAFFDASMDHADGGVAIPVIWGSDAVHGHSNIVGATLFPQNIGLGATRNPALLRRIGEVTAVEMRTTGIDWDFSPVVAVARDDRWGRTYESYSEDPELVRELARKMVEGLQGPPRAKGFLGGDRVIAAAKHFLGDGGTEEGKDQGDNLSSEAALRDIHAAGYIGALQAGVQSIMVSLSSWRGEKMHGQKTLLTDILKKRLGFDGILVGDWNGHGQVSGCSNASCAKAFNAGIDIFMVPEDWKALYDNTLAQVRSGEIPQKRLDDAVRRILRVKMRAGLFEAGKPSARPLGGQFARIGTREHRDVARQAVRESIVLLKNNNATLPIAGGKHVLVTGDGADNIGKQSGGWTLTWQGDGNTNADFPGGTSIWAGIRSAIESAGGRATLSADGSFTEKPDVAVIVFGESPYAEFQGDRKTIVYEGEDDLALLRRLRKAGIPTVSLFLSGRPMWVNPFLNESDAFVAAWLPGTEGDGVADVLVGDGEGKPRHDFRGKLAFSWPKLATQVVLNHGQTKYDPLFPFGFGLTYKDAKTLAALPVDTGGVQLSRPGILFSGGVVAPWKLAASGAVTMKTVDTDVQEGGRSVDWTGAGEVTIRNEQPVDLTRESNDDLSLVIDLMMRKAPAAPVLLNGVDITSMLRVLPLGEWKTVSVRLRCFEGFEGAGTKMSRVRVPVRLATSGQLGLTFSRVRFARTAQTGCPGS